MRLFVKVLRKQYPPLVSKKQHFQRQLYFPGVVCCPSTHQDRLSSAALGLLSTTARGEVWHPATVVRMLLCYFKQGWIAPHNYNERKRSDKWSGVHSVQARRNARKLHAQSPWEVNILQVTSGTMAEPRQPFKPVRLWFHYRPLTHRSAFTSQTARTGSSSQRHRLPVWSLLWSHPHGAMQGGWVA